MLLKEDAEQDARQKRMPRRLNPYNLYGVLQRL